MARKLRLVRCSNNVHKLVRRLGDNQEHSNENPLTLLLNLTRTICLKQTLSSWHLPSFYFTDCLPYASIIYIIAKTGQKARRQRHLQWKRESSLVLAAISALNEDCHSACHFRKTVCSFFISRKVRCSCSGLRNVNCID